MLFSAMWGQTKIESKIALFLPSISASDMQQHLRWRFQHLVPLEKSGSGPFNRSASVFHCSPNRLITRSGPLEIRFVESPPITRNALTLVCCDVGPMRRDQAHKNTRDLYGSAFSLHPWGRRENLLCNQKRGVYHRDSQSLFIILALKPYFTKTLLLIIVDL